MNGKMLTKAIAIALLASLFPVLQFAEATYLPSVKSESAPIISPSSAWTYYSGLGVSSPSINSERDFRIKDMALTLQNDPDRIYEYVRNSVEMTPMFGIKKGALGALLDERGTAFDQAQLMVELLRESGYVASYQYGTLTLTGVELGDWLGITNLNGTPENANDDFVEEAVATKILSSGGIPASISSSGGHVTSATIAHIWVVATLNGSSYVFDPAYKPHKIYEGINLGSTMGFNKTSFLSAAYSSSTSGSDNGIPYRKDVNTGQVGGQLSAMSAALYNHITTNMATSSLEQVIGGKRIVDDWSQHRDVALPGHGVTASWSGEIPDAFRTKISISVYDLTADLWLDDVFDRNVSVGAQYDSGSGNSYYTIEHESTFGAPDTSAKVTSNLSTTAVDGNPYIVEFDIDHPYAVTAGSYMDDHIEKQLYNSGHLERPHFVLNAGYVSAKEAHGFSLAAQSYPMPTGGYGTYGPKIKKQGLQTRASQRQMLSELTASYDFLARVGNVEFQHHHSIGVVIPVVDADMIIDFDTAMSVTSLESSGDAEAAWHLAATAIASEVEAGVFERARDVWEPISGTRMFSYLNSAASNRKFFHLPAYGNITDLNSQLVNFEQSYKDAVQAYLDQGFEVILLKNGDISFNGSDPDPYVGNVDWKIGAFFARKASSGEAAYLTFTTPDSGGTRYLRKGGTGGTTTTTDDALAAYKIETSKAVGSIDESFGGVNIDMKTGTMRMNVPILSVGQGEFPYKLSSIAEYDSSLESQDATSELDFDTFKQGWTHNWRVRAAFGGDLNSWLGAAQSSDAAPTIAAFYSLLELNSGTPGLDDLLASPFVATWWMNGVAGNTVTIERGTSKTQFVRKADGTFNSPPLSHATMTQSGSGRKHCTKGLESQRQYSSYWGTTVSYIDDNGNEYFFNQVLDTTDGSNDYSLCRFWNPKLTKIEHNSGVDVTLSYYDSGHLQQVTNGIGSTLDFDLHKAPSYPNEMNTCRIDNVYASCDDYFGPVHDPSGRQGTFFGGKLPIDIYWVDPEWAMSRVEQGNAESYRFYHEDDHLDGDFKLKKVFLPSAPPPDPLNGDFSGGMVEFLLDVDGRPRTIKDAEGNETHYYFAGKRTETVDPFGAHSTLLFNDRSQVVAAVDNDGNTTTSDYDEVGRLVAATLPKGNSVEIDYDQWNNVIAVRDIASDDVNDVIEVEASYGSVLTRSGTVYNKPLWMEDGENNRTSFTYYSSTGLLWKVEQPLVDTDKDGQADSHPVTQYAYDGYGRQTQMINPDGRVDQIAWSSSTGFKLSETVDVGNLALTTSYGYSMPPGATYNAGAVGVPTSTIDPRGNVTWAEFDELLKPVKVIPPVGAITVNSYDIDGLLVQTDLLDPATSVVLQTTSKTYDARKLLATETDPQGYITTKSYDAVGRVDVVTDAEGRQVKTTYTLLGQVDTIYRAWRSGFDAADPDNFGCSSIPGSLQQCYQRFAYDENGNVVALTDARNNATAYDFDGHNRPNKTTWPDNTYEENQVIDANGNVLTRRGRDGLIYSYDFDSLNREIERTALTWRNLRTFYDVAGKVTRRAFWHTTNQVEQEGVDYTYDTAGRVTSRSFVGTTDLSWQWDDSGNRKRITHGDGFYADYAFDEGNRMVGVCRNASATWTGSGVTCSDASAPLAAYSYDELDRRSSVTYGNGNLVAYGYNVDSTLSSLSHTFEAGQPSSADQIYSFAYNKVNQVVQRQVSNSVFAWTPVGSETETYGAANSVNQYPSVAGQSLTWSTAGNLTSDGVNTYSYSPYNVMWQAVTPMHSVTFGYNVEGARDRKTVDGVNEFFLADAQTEMNSVVVDHDGARAFSSSSQAIRRYVYGPGIDERIIMIDERASGGAKTYWYHVDHQGSTIALSNSSGSVVETYSYDEFGNSVSLIGNPYRYTGRRLDAETGLYYYRARYYAPAFGRFLQTDPVGYEDQMNLYTYVGNDPMNLSDPSGSVIEEIVITAPKPVVVPAPPPIVVIPVAIGGIFYLDYRSSQMQAAMGIACGAFGCVSLNNGDNGTGEDGENSGSTGDKPYSGETPDDKPEDFQNLGPRKGHKSKPRKKKSDGSIWEVDVDEHAGSKWKRWPNERAWEKRKGRESVRKDGSIVNGPGDG